MTANNTPSSGAPSGDTPSIDTVHTTTLAIPPTGIRRPREIVDDTVNINAPGNDWNREPYTANDGEKRIRLTRRS